MAKQNYTYIDVLQDMVNAYNKTTHGSLGRSPANVNEANEGEVRLEQYMLRRKDKR